MYNNIHNENCIQCGRNKARIQRELEQTKKIVWEPAAYEEIELHQPLPSVPAAIDTRKSVAYARITYPELVSDQTVILSYS